MEADAEPEDASIMPATTPLPETQKIVEDSYPVSEIRKVMEADAEPEDASIMPATAPLPETQKIVEASYPVSEIRKIVEADDGPDQPENARKSESEFMEHDDTKHDESQKIANV